MTEETETNIPVLPELEDEIDITVNDKLRTFTMKFALLRELTRAFPNPQDPQLVFQDQTLFETALIILLVPRTATGKPEELADDWSLDDYEIAPQDAVDLVKWSMEHVLRFFLTKYTMLPNLGETSISQIEALLSSLPGLKDFHSKKASVGLTESNTPIFEPSIGASLTET